MRPSLHSLGRVLLAGIFLRGGLEAFEEPHARANLAAPVIERMRPYLPFLPQEPPTVVQLNALAQVTAGTLLAAGVLPRLSAFALVGSLVPTTLGGHRFWEFDDPAQRAAQRIQFLKNAAIAGGLLTVAFGPRER
ncbi:MAG TPA: DoxX family protein [Candidatus Limnocylindrales bacterium]